ncbi:DNA replication and checkpoint protein-domain-containing protein [Lophiotrema nucula]|uniref:DNA replication regulator SLD2 n=1 Tax=Lophiotrema nucula TaxID=690887 RepID=A0A6A5Z8F8_9PLEO|nr:DNA replication and checkpoint protein-domain-containing protein [Lophiotrema nucula]
MEKAELEQRSTVLRQELKVWEKQFAKESGGRKAGREDIKADAAISQKYKEYNRIRDVLSGRAAPQTPSKRPTSRRQNLDVERTPKARPVNLTATPLKRKLEDTVDQAAVFLSPQGPAMIGPTPQRDGIVLGLFDILPAETPSKRRAVLADVEANIVQTPSKNDRKAESESSYETAARGEKTPQSSAKRFLLDRFVTPKKRKLDDQSTPTSTMKEFATPAFLRRDNRLDTVNEENEPTSRPAPWKRRSLGRSLSSMIQAMKKDEEDRLDEEADIMRELELEADGFAPPPKKVMVSKILVEDSQAAMPLGPDRGVESEEDEREAEEATEQPRKVWKKKGLKRQTRKVLIRPHITRPDAQPTALNLDSSDDETAVDETQGAQDIASDHEISNDDESDYGSDASHAPKKRKVQPKKKAEAEQEKGAKEGPVKTAARKIKATAHANYRKLKIKSKGNGAQECGCVARIQAPKHSCRPGSSMRSSCDCKTSFVGVRHAVELVVICPNGCTSGFTRSSSLLCQPAAKPPDLLVGARATSPKPSPSAKSQATNTTTTLPSPFPPSTASLQNILSTSDSTVTPAKMAERELEGYIHQLKQTLQSRKYQQSQQLLQKAKVALLHLNALIPQENSSQKNLKLARETLELGAITSIRLKDPVSFTRYFQQLQPFYSLPDNVLSKQASERSKVTGLYLLLLLSDGDYAGFHTLLETLEVEVSANGGNKGLEDDVFIQYPIRLERALMEGSYDRVWGETKGERVPSEEFALFSEVLIGTIRKEIASCSEKAYPSIPISDAKSLLFLDSEGSVVQFAKETGWVVKDGRIYFPVQEDEYLTKDILVTSDQVIENTLGYARELETIV